MKTLNEIIARQIVLDKIDKKGFLDFSARTIYIGMPDYFSLYKKTGNLDSVEIKNKLVSFLLPALDIQLEPEYYSYENISIYKDKDTDKLVVVSQDKRSSQCYTVARLVNLSSQPSFVSLEIYI